MGFEPTVGFPLHTLSKRAPSTTRTSLRVCRISGLRASGSARRPNCDRNCDTRPKGLRSLTGMSSATGRREPDQYTARQAATAHRSFPRSCPPGAMSSVNAGGATTHRAALNSPIRPVSPLLEDRANVLEQDEQVVRVAGSRHETKSLVEDSRVLILGMYGHCSYAGNVGGLERPQHGVF